MRKLVISKCLLEIVLVIAITIYPNNQTNTENTQFLSVVEVPLKCEYSKLTRKISFVKTSDNYLSENQCDIYVLTNGWSGSYYEERDMPVIKKRMAETVKKFSSDIELASSLSGIPPELLLAVSYIESGGNEKAISGCGALGIMQIIPESATDILFLEKRDGRLSDREIDFLRQKLGNKKVNALLSMKHCGDKRTGNVICKNDLMNPSICFYVGAVYIGRLIDENIDKNKEIRLDKVVFRYNVGYFYKIKGNTKQEVYQETYSKGGKETRAYIDKLLGLHGALTISLNLYASI